MCWHVGRLRCIASPLNRMLIHRLLTTVASAGGNGTSCDECTPILANASMICLSADVQSNSTVQCLADDEGSGVFGSYLIFWRCTVHESPLALIFLIPWLIMLLSALGSTADLFLMPQLHFLSEFMRLSPDVAGVTLLAIGNGAPDVFSAIALATANVNTPMDLSFMLSDIVGGCVSPSSVLEPEATASLTPARAMPAQLAVHHDDCGRRRRPRRRLPDSRMDDRTLAFLAGFSHASRRCHCRARHRGGWLDRYL